MSKFVLKKADNSFANGYAKIKTGEKYTLPQNTPMQQRMIDKPSNKPGFFTARAKRVLLSANHIPVYSGYCSACGAAVELVTFSQAVEITADDLDKLIENAAVGSLHLAILPEALLICLESLLRNIKQNGETR